jgi:hypothetical protein
LIVYEESEAIIAIVYSIFSELHERIKKTTDKKEILHSIRLLNEILQFRNMIGEHITHGGSKTGFDHSAEKLIFNSSQIMMSSKVLTVDEIKKKLLQDNLGFNTLLPSFQPSIPPIQKWKKHHPREEATQYFYSYAHADFISEKIIDLLKGMIPYQVKFWVDKEDLSRHDKIPEKLSQAIDSSNAIIIMLSKNYLTSKWCNHEWVSAIQQNLSKDTQMRLYVCVIDNCNIPSFLAPFYRTNLKDFPTPEGFLELMKLCTDILEYERVHK